MRASQFVAGVLPGPIGAAARKRKVDEAWFHQPAFGSAEKDDWFGEIVPTEPQRLPSCVFRATAQALMALIRREHGRGAIPKGKVLDGDALYKSFCDRTRGGDYSEGAQLDDGIKEAVEQGWIAGVRYGIARIPYQYEYINRMLKVGPLICGFATSPEWFKADRKTGQIPLGAMPRMDMGHAVLCVDVQRFGDDEYHIHAGSWGVDSWGRHGYGVQTMGQARQCALGDAVAWYLPDGTGKAWREHLREGGA